MNYQSEHLSGIFSTIAGLVVGAVEMKQEADATNRYNADLALANAVDTATARDNAIEAKYAANRAVLQSEIDAEKQKRYLIIGASVGIPLITLMLLKRKG